MSINVQRYIAKQSTSLHELISTKNVNLDNINVVAHDIAAQMEYKGLSVAGAANAIVMNKFYELSGRGGAIVLDKDGNLAMPFNTQSMMRGFISADGYSEIYV